VRAVLDTNVVISAAVTSGGVADRLLRLAALRRFTMIVSPKLLFEIQATAGEAYLAKQLPGGEDPAVFLAQSGVSAHPRSTQRCGIHSRPTTIGRTTSSWPLPNGTARCSSPATAGCSSSIPTEHRHATRVPRHVRSEVLTPNQ